MKQQATHLCLKPGVTMTEQGGNTCLVLNGHSQIARDAMQATIIQQLMQGTPTPEALTQQLCALQPQPGCTSDAALALASFILDFQDYL